MFSLPFSSLLEVESGRHSSAPELRGLVPRSVNPARSFPASTALSLGSRDGLGRPGAAVSLRRFSGDENGAFDAAAKECLIAPRSGHQHAA